MLLAVTDRGYRFFLDNSQGRSELPSQFVLLLHCSSHLESRLLQRLATSCYNSISSSSSRAAAGAQQQVITRAVSSVFYAGDVFMMGFNYNSLPCQICCITLRSMPHHHPGPSEKATFIDL